MWPCAAAGQLADWKASMETASNQLSIAFCTTVKGRTQHLRHTLPANLSDNASYRNARFIILDYGSQDGLLEYLKSNHRNDIAKGRVVVYSFRWTGPFRMAHAKNMAHRCGLLEGAEILMNLDADGLTGPNFAHWISRQFNTYGFNILLQAMWNRWVDFDGRREWMAAGPDGTLGPPVPKGVNGRMGVTRNAFLKAGGYHERFEAWGPDDKDFNIRLRRLGYEPRLIDRCHLNGLLHNDRVRFKEYPEAALTKGYGFDIKVPDSPETIANFGQFGMGTVYRNFDFLTPIELGPVPTRIFGIGMHKTATTSLRKALRMLGFDSAHWETAHWARAIWDEMEATGRSNTLERFYTLCDLPIPLLYKELDAAYPGSKFILTLRDEAKWIESVRRHWSADYNPYRSQWSNDPFTHRVHKLLYGQKGFDAERFLARYRRHNAEVIEYFRDRADLLVMDMDAGAGWPELCGFLGCPFPAREYPHVLRTAGAGAEAHWILEGV